MAVDKLSKKILSRGTRLFIGTESSGSVTYGDFIPDLVSVPGLGAQPEQVDVTTLEDKQKHYVPGLEDLGSLDFGFVYDVEKKIGSGSSAETVFDYLKGLDDNTQYFKIAFTNGDDTNLETYAEFTFTGIPRTYMNGAEVGARVDFTMSVGLQSDIEMV